MRLEGKFAALRRNGLRTAFPRGRAHAFILAAAIAVAGCADQMAYLQGSESSGAATQSVYYAGSDNLALYGEPSNAKPPVAKLSLHKKVVRDKIEKGYAHVKVDGTGQTGWVVNAKLIWKLPSSGTAASSPKTPPAPEAMVQEPTPAPPAAAPTAAETPASDAPSAPAKKAADPSIFDAF